MTSVSENGAENSARTKKAPKLSKENPYYHTSHDYIEKDHIILERKEKELEDTYLFVHERLESLVSAVVNYEDMGSVISISNEIGRAVAQTRKIKEDVFTFFENEEKHLEHLLDDKHLNTNYVKGHHNHNHHHHHKVEKVERGSSEESLKGRAKSSSQSSNSDASKSGYMSKKNGMRNKWSKRFFILDPSTHSLKWFSNEESSKTTKKPKGILDLHKSKLVSLFDNGNGQLVELSTRFAIQFGNKLLVLETKDELEKKEWLSAVSTVIEKGQSVSSPKAPKKEKEPKEKEGKKEEKEKESKDIKEEKQKESKEKKEGRESRDKELKEPKEPKEHKEHKEHKEKKEKKEKKSKSKEGKEQNPIKSSEESQYTSEPSDQKEKN